MNILHVAYAAVPLALSPIVVPGIRYWAKRNPIRRFVWAQRLGYDPGGLSATFRGMPKIWIHAVSVGEVKAAEAVIKVLDTVHPSAAFLLTTTTTTGQQEAQRRLGQRTSVCYAPVDLWTAVGRFLLIYKPDMLICMETEIWPNWIEKAHRAGMKIIFLNGRLSNRSIRSYMKIRPLLKSVLEKADAFSMISDVDARRIIALGAPGQRVVINGNVKTDFGTEKENDKFIHGLKQLFAVAEDTPVFIGGSIRSAEVDMLIDVYDKLAVRIPELLFILAPRHIDKSSVIEQAARERGIAFQRRTDLAKSDRGRTAQLVILDTIGELGDVYSLARVVFGGASLVPLGGQNILEAAAWAKPVLFGPYMDDFPEARTLLEKSGGGICVNNTDELVERATYLLIHPEAAHRLGRLARQALVANQGAAARHAQVALRLLSTAHL